MIKAKKSLGQNFLKSSQALSRIVIEADLKTTDVVLEIGPGKGILTKKLLEKSSKVIAVEKDPELIEFLKKHFEKEIDSGKLDLILGDILEINNLSSHIKNKYKIVANIPYYITGAILRKFLESENPPERMVLLVQKEVAERIVARDNKESILSMSIKIYGEPKFIEKVPARYFSPAPKVDSAILLISNISKKYFIENNITETDFFNLIKSGFAHKRKVLSSNLKPLLGGRTPKCLEVCKIPAKVRAEDLVLENWICLAKNLDQ